MSDFVPANIIETPDFAGLAQQRINQKRQDEAATNSYLDKFVEEKNLYLDGDKEAVQTAWDKVQSAMDIVAANDNLESRNNLKSAYADYTQIAGTAQVLAQEHRKQVAAFNADPTKFAMSGTEFLDWDRSFRTQKRDLADMVAALENPNALPSAGSYALLNPYDQARILQKETSNVVAGFYDRRGNLDVDGLRERITDIATKKMSGSPEALERAAIWGATTANNPQSGFAGDGDGRINSLEELELVRNSENKQEYIDFYINSLVDNYIDLLPLKVARPSRTSGGGSGGSKKLKKMSEMTQEVYTGAVDGPFAESDRRDRSKYVEINFLTLPTKVDGVSQIGMGADGEIYVNVEEEVEVTVPAENDYEDPTTKTEKRMVYRPATALEIGRIQTKYQYTYDLQPLTQKPGSNQSGEGASQQGGRGELD